MSFELILPFLKNIEHLILDPTISEIMINGNRKVFIDRDGCLLEMSDIEVIEERLRFGILNIARVLDNDINEGRPILDARLPDGSRVGAVIPPASLGGSTLAIRKFLPISFTTEDLVQRGSLPEIVLGRLLEAIDNRDNIIISGGTTTGKTTMLNALVKHIPPDERIVVIEDTAEIQLDHRNTVRLEARKAMPGRDAVTIQHLIEATLRLRPDRIIVGEVRGATAYDLLQAMNTGHSGTLTTLHANHARLALNRLAAMALRADKNLDHSAIRAETADVIKYVVQIRRFEGKRYVSELVEVEGYDYRADSFVTRSLYTADSAH
ncbi:MAG: ATPase, T2SS/T4P/T4SS family [Bryobacteraceae bacterium]